MNGMEIHFYEKIYEAECDHKTVDAIFPIALWVVLTVVPEQSPG